MVDNKQDNDEYEFADLDVMGSDSMGESDTHSKSTTPSQGARDSGNNDVKRKALIVVVLVVTAMLLYKFTGSFFSKKTEPVKSDVSVTTRVSQPIVAVTKPVDIQPATSITPVVTQAPAPVENPAITQKLASMDLSQQSIRSDVNSVSNQLGGIHSNIDALNNKIANLGQMVTTLSHTIEQQSIQIAHLVEVRVQKAKPVIRRKTAHSPVYFIQAVIPGRAWLIASNGSTLTVREGTNVAGYGVVKLIDPVQGRVTMSSGRVIRFSQQDS